MPGYSHVSPNSEIRKWTSHGRTRQPKNVAGYGGDPSQGLPISIGTAYDTENQRFLLVLSTTDPIPDDRLQVWSHAMPGWANITTGSLAAGRQHVFEIAGADKVRVSPGVINGNIFIATSTF